MVHALPFMNSNPSFVNCTMDFSGSARSFAQNVIYMKYVLYTLLAASISIAGCRKSEKALPASPTISETINDCRALINGANKKSATGLEMDYDLVIKEVSKNKYKVKLKMNGLTLNGKKVSEYKPDGYSSVVVALNSTKEKPEQIAMLDLSEEKQNSNIFVSKEFEYIGELDYELVDASIKMAINGGTVSISDIIKVNLAGFVITVNQDNKNIGNGQCWFEFTNTGNEPKISFTTFALLFANVKGEGKCSVSDDGTFFVLPSGNTEIQDPAIARVHLEKTGKDEFGYMTVTIKGDPAHTVSSVTYQQPSVSANDPKDPKAMIVYPVMKFELTHFNQKTGVLRFQSTQTWKDVYGKGKNSPLYDAKGLDVETALYAGGH